MKRIGVVGRGKLGSLLSQRDGFSLLECDVTDISSIQRAVTYWKPDLIINCAGISSIDECEKDYDKAIQVNVHGIRNLHKVFGAGVLSISSDHIFDGKSKNYKENTKPLPKNCYGFTKLGMESVSHIWDGKIIRLSRSVSIEDVDISTYLMSLYREEEINVPTFIFRNFTHKQFAVDGLVYFVDNFETMPQVVNYGGLSNLSFYEFMLLVAERFGFDKELIIPRKADNPSYSPRPFKGGFSVNLAKKLGFPMYKISDTIDEMSKEANL